MTIYKVVNTKPRDGNPQSMTNTLIVIEFFFSPIVTFFFSFPLHYGKGHKISYYRTITK